MSIKMNEPALRFPEFSGKWEEKKLKDYVISHKGGASLTPKDFIDNSGYEVIPKKAIVSGGLLQLDRENPTFCREEFFFNNDRSVVDTSYLITTLRDLVPSGPSIGFIVENKNKNPLILAQGVYGLKIDTNLDHKFLVQFSNRGAYRRVMQRILVGSTQVHIRNQDFFNIALFLPQKPEQQKIATFLSTVDSKIEQLTKKQSLLASYKKGVMQEIFSQKIRFKADDGSDYPDWEEKRLGEITYNVSKKNKENISYPVYSINNKVGFIPQGEQFEGVDSNQRNYDISLYKVIQENTFAYNPARIDVGSLGYSGNLNNIIISSLYVCFKTNDQIDDRFISQYFKTFYFNKSVLRNTEGGVRNYLFYDNFSNIKTFVPSKKEQIKIANFLSSIDTKIDQNNQQLNQAKQFKKALLQQMFV